MYVNEYEKRLTGGHPNSLGNTLEVVDEILNDQSKLRDLFDCYKSKDEVVRLRVSNGIKRVCKENPSWVSKYLDELLGDISKIDQPSTKWTLAQLFMMLDKYMDNNQRGRAIIIIKNNFQTEMDWIVQNFTAESLMHFAKNDPELQKWLKPELKRMQKSKHKSVAKRANNYLQILSNN